MPQSETAAVSAVQNADFCGPQLRLEIDVPQRIPTNASIQFQKNWQMTDFPNKITSKLKTQFRKTCSKPVHF